MTDRDWTLLKTLAEERNVTRAAERLYISQPALTYRIRVLEDEFGCKIVIRTPHGIMLTPQGEYLVEYAKEMLLSLAKTKEQLASFDNQVKGPLRVGSSAIFANYELPQLLRGFLETYPNVDIFLKTGRSLQVSKMLEREDVSIAILRGDHNWKEEKRLLLTEPVCLVSKNPLAVADLPEKPRIVYGTDSSLQKLVDEWWRQTYSVSSKESLAVDTMDTCRRMVLQNLGWAILPSIGLSEYDQLYVEPLFWPDGSPVIRKSWICCATAALQLPTVCAFVDYITQQMSQKMIQVAHLYGKKP